MRIKRGKTKKSKHKKVLKLAKGYRLTYSKLYRRAKEALLHAGDYSFAHRKKRKGQYRKTWIKRINAALTGENLSYSQFINKLKVAKVDLDRKSLAIMALDHPEAFKEVIAKVK